MKQTRTSLRWLCLSAPLLFASVLMADDTEIYYSQATSANPNILFVLDTSLSMECKPDPVTGLYDKPDASCTNKNIVPDSGGKTRIQVLKEAFNSVMANAPSNINVGLMRYGGHSEDNANGVSFPVKPIDLDKDGKGDALSILRNGISDLSKDNLPNPVSNTPVRQFLSQITSSWNVGGNTPIVDALYEAALYYRGEPVDFGNLAANHIRAAQPATYINNNALNCTSQTTECNKTAGKCNPALPMTNCTTRTRTDCKKYITVQQSSTCQQCTTVQQPGTCKEQCTTVQQPGTCQQCTTVQQPGTCQQCTTIGYDESGKPITQCTTVACMKDVEQCIDVPCMKDVEQCIDVPCMKDAQQCVKVPCMKDIQQCVETVSVTEEFCKQTITTCKGGKNYVSPIQYECQNSYIVLMSDGRPEYSGSASNGGGINKYPLRKNTVETLTQKGTNCSNNAPNGYKSGTCGPELTKFLATTDQILDDKLAGKQTIGTFTVAFGVDDPQGQAYLASLANMPEGFLTANNGDTLKMAFEQIIRQVNRMEDGQMLAFNSIAYQHDASAKQDSISTKLSLPQQLFGVVGTGIAVAEMQSSLLDALNPVHYWRQLKNFAATNMGAFNANNLNELTNSFNAILDKIDASTSSFSSPTISIDKSNMLAHEDNIYIPIFERSHLPLWSGNLKKFKIATKPLDIDNDGKLDLQKGQIYGKNNKPAVDTKGQLTDEALDFWSDSTTPDGKTISAGGAAAKLNPLKRNLYTDAGGSIGTLTLSNTQISKTLLGDAAMSDTLRNDLIRFAQGYAKDGSSRHHIGDIMNNKPIIVDYNNGESYILVATNEGYLHAFDAATGTEKWAFMPESLLKNIRIFYDNNQPKKHIYGIDGQLSLRLLDKNADGKVDPTQGEKVFVYFGMRRGGRSYYALDITDTSNPNILWKIDNNTNGFSELGETWSKPTLAKMWVQPNSLQAVKLKDVLVFGAGFDPELEKDNPNSRSPDKMGRDVFIIDAENGDLLWSLRNNVTGASSKLKNNIPGDIRVMDMDRNGGLDRLYFADTGGNIWRVDMDMDIRDTDNSLYDYTDARLTKLADLGGNGSDKRKFYYEPDVALMKHQGRTILTLAIGSGYRSRPLNTIINDRFYVLKDPNIYQAAPDNFTALTDDDLEEVDAMVTSGKDLLTTNKAGWYYNLPHTGEKVLAPATTFLNKVIFTTFAADGTTTNPCIAPPNSARAYVLNLLDGQAVADLDRDGSLDANKDRAIIAGINEILNGAQIIFNAPVASDGISDCAFNDCKQTIDIRVGKIALPVMDETTVIKANGVPVKGTAGSVDLTDILPRMFWRDQNVSD